MEKSEPRSMAEAAEAFGISYRTVARWVQDGFIVTYTQAKKGKGWRVPWGRKQNSELASLARLRTVLSFQELRQAAKFLRAAHFNPFSGGPRTFGVITGPRGKRKLLKVISKSEIVEVITGKSGQRLLPLIVNLKVPNGK